MDASLGCQRWIARGSPLCDPSRREFDKLSELESVDALVAETTDRTGHEVMHRVLTGSMRSMFNFSLGRLRLSRP